MTEKELLQDMMEPNDLVFNAVVHARNITNLGTGSLIRTFVSEYAMSRGIELEWPKWDERKRPNA